MRQVKFGLTLSLLALFQWNSYGHIDSLRTEAQIRSEAFIGHGDTAPFWFHSGTDGRWDKISKSQMNQSAGFEMHFTPNEKWTFSSHIVLLHNNRNGSPYLHTGNIKATYRWFYAEIGKHQFNPIFSEEYTGHGSYLFGNNQRPIPRITAGIESYMPLPILGNRFEIKGHLSHGWLDDNNEHRYHKRVLLHEKNAYARFNLGMFKPYAGLNHSALLGGYRWQNGEYTNTKIPRDYWPSFFAKGSDKIGGGEETNAAGAHMGLYDFGFYLETKQSHFKFYYQAPFADGSGMRPLIRNIDQIAGVSWHSKSRKGPLTHLTLEWINTSYQSGNGTPDPMIPRTDGDGMRILILSSDEMKDQDYRNQLMNDLGQDWKENYSQRDVVLFLQYRYNNGHRFGGRDGYMSNGVYPAGWTYYDQVMGSPLNLTHNQMTHVDGEFGIYNRNNIINDRFRAFHIGAKGEINSQLKWETKMTISKNYGSYYQQYPGRYTWEETPDYYFKGGKMQTYTYTCLTWIPKKHPSFRLNLAGAIDQGDIFKNRGLKIGVTYIF